MISPYDEIGRHARLKTLSLGVLVRVQVWVYMLMFFIMNPGFLVPVAGSFLYNVGGYSIVFYLTYEEEITQAAVIYSFIRAAL